MRPKNDTGDVSEGRRQGLVDPMGQGSGLG
jgi:hypothetical protein